MELDDLKKDPEKIRQLISLLSSILESGESTPTAPQSPVEIPPPTQTANLGNKKPTKFLNMPEYTMFKEDVAIDKALNKYPPTARQRGQSKIDVVCRICAKKENIHPSMLCDSVDRYKCNNCAASPG